MLFLSLFSLFTPEQSGDHANAEAKSAAYRCYQKNVAGRRADSKERHVNKAAYRREPEEAARRAANGVRDALREGEDQISAKENPEIIDTRCNGCACTEQDQKRCQPNMDQNADDFACFCGLLLSAQGLRLPLLLLFQRDQLLAALLLKLLFPLQLRLAFLFIRLCPLQTSRRMWRN